MTTTFAHVRKVMRDRAMSAAETTDIFNAQDSGAALKALGPDNVVKAVAYIVENSPDRTSDFETALIWLARYGYPQTRAVAAGLAAIKRDNFPS